MGYEGYYYLTFAAMPATFWVLFKYKTSFRRTQIETESSEGNSEEVESLLNSYMDRDYDNLIK